MSSVDCLSVCLSYTPTGEVSHEQLVCTFDTRLNLWGCLSQVPGCWGCAFESTAPSVLSLLDVSSLVTEQKADHREVRKLAYEHTADWLGSCAEHQWDSSARSGSGKDAALPWVTWGSRCLPLLAPRVPSPSPRFQASLSPLCALLPPLRLPSHVPHSVSLGFCSWSLFSLTVAWLPEGWGFGLSTSLRLSSTWP